MKLEQNDIQSSTWGKLERHYTARLEELRTKLENDMPHDHTVKLRGQIREVRSLLALARKEPPPAVETVPFE